MWPGHQEKNFFAAFLSNHGILYKIGQDFSEIQFPWLFNRIHQGIQIQPLLDLSFKKLEKFHKV